MNNQYRHKATKRPVELLHKAFYSEATNYTKYAAVYKFTDSAVDINVRYCSWECFEVNFEEVVEFKTKDGFTINEGDYYYEITQYLGRKKLTRHKAEKSSAEWIKDNGYAILSNAQDIMLAKLKKKYAKKVKKIKNPCFTYGDTEV